MSQLIISELTQQSIEMLSDDDVLQLADLQWDESEGEELADLLDDQREDLLDDKRRARLDDLLGRYRHDMVIKSCALRIAVERGLRPRLDAPIQN